MTPGGCSPSLPTVRRNLWMSQQSAAAKPSLQGVRIKARKGAVKAQAKHEPTGEHRYTRLTTDTPTQPHIHHVQSLETSFSNTLKTFRPAISTLSPTN